MPKFTLFSVCLLLLANSAAPQEPIKISVGLVAMNFSVRDGNGALVDNLTANDFAIFEDSVPQKIAHFSRSSDLPLTLGLIVDASGSQDHFAKMHARDLEVFLKDALGPHDRVFVVGFANSIRLISEFSSPTTDLLADWKRYDKSPHHFPEVGPSEDREMGTAFYDSIFYSITEKMGKEGGRKALLVFSDGEDNSSSHDMMTTIETAQANNVAVYTIRYTDKKHGQLTARNQYGIRVMDRIAHETGGAHIDAEATDPHTYFRQIAEELRTSYELAYYPVAGGDAEQFRKVAIRPNLPGLIVRCKTGYYRRAQ